MAFRRRRRAFGRRRRAVASAFAPAKSGGGNLTWEAAGTTCWSTIDQVFGSKGTLYQVECDGEPVDYRTYALVLIPINTNRGTVTLLRVRGYLGCASKNFGNVDQSELREQTVHFMLQLVPHEPTLINNIDATQLLSGNLATNQESNRIIMQWIRTVGGEFVTQHSFTDPVAPNGDSVWFREIDVRTKRRFDRTQWALALTATTTEPGGFEVNRVFANFRMLFRTDDGI